MVVEFSSQVTYIKTIGRSFAVIKYLAETLVQPTRWNVPSLSFLKINPKSRPACLLSTVASSEMG